ncbi:MAG: phosphoenolpyruvate carboxykinase (ATP) [Eubacteriaceae bacterium]|nr:phosphoenolpyruvate carboxykinase (ATP) [Eubacteriaceae bacterium]
MYEIDLSYLGIKGKKGLANATAPTLVKKALAGEEGFLSNTGAFVVSTGKYTGRSPDDRFIVDDEVSHDMVEWGKINMPIGEDKFESLYNKMTDYVSKLDDIYVFNGFAGADTQYQLPIRVINEFASQNLFVHNLFIDPKTDDEAKKINPGFTIIAAPGYLCDPAVDGTHSEAAVIISFKRKIVLIAGTRYCGEIKKSIFSVMNGLLPQQDVFPMHCSANMDDDGRTALFFGLSGTGKTTLSADPNRGLIGDDEHGWSKNGIFNFEGGCFAKCIDLTEESEPEIYRAIRFGSVVENVVCDENGVPDYADSKYTENTRVGYPLDYIPNAVIPSVGGHPKTVIFLTADAFGALPPVAKLNKYQAMYHFVSGYTSKLAGTERGITEPQTTFSTCFGAPFLPLPAARYAELLGERIDTYNCNVYLVNTGWSGGAYGVGKRMKLAYTRAIVAAATSGELENAEFIHDDIFNVEIPTSCPGVPSDVLIARNTWKDKADYDRVAQNLANHFVDNFKKYTNMPQNIIDAGPQAK